MRPPRLRPAVAMLGALALLCGSPAFASDSVDALVRCSGLEDDPGRLACYDAVARTLTDAEAPAPAGADPRARADREPVPPDAREPHRGGTGPAPSSLASRPSTNVLAASASSNSRMARDGPSGLGSAPVSSRGIGSRFSARRWGAASCSARQAARPASAPPTEVTSALPDPADPRRERRRSGIPAPPCLTLRQARRILGTRGETGHSLRRLHAQRHHRTHKAVHR